MTWELAGKSFSSRLLLGTARYASFQCLADAIRTAQVEIITIALRRQQHYPESSKDFWNTIKQLNCHLLPNTAGCQSAKDTIVTAQMARELFNTNWIKLEVIRDDYTLQPDPFELVIAAKELLSQGFEVFPYCTDDLAVCETLANLGCRIIMPWAAPIGSGKGIINPTALRTLRQRLKHLQLIVDAGIGAPSHAAQAMELGFDGVLVNSAVALAADSVNMAAGFAKAVEAGRLAYQAGLMPAQDFATPSTPMAGKPFWHQAGQHV
jgi:thiazole synthase